MYEKLRVFDSFLDSNMCPSSPISTLLLVGVVIVIIIAAILMYMMFGPPATSSILPDTATTFTISDITLTNNQAAVDVFKGTYTQIEVTILKQMSINAWGTNIAAWSLEDDDLHYVLLTQDSTKSTDTFTFHLVETSDSGDLQSIMHTKDGMELPNIALYTGKWIHGSSGYTAMVTIV